MFCSTEVMKQNQATPRTQSRPLDLARPTVLAPQHRFKQDYDVLRSSRIGRAPFPRGAVRCVPEDMDGRAVAGNV